METAGRAGAPEPALEPSTRPPSEPSLDAQVDAWRTHLRGRREIANTDVAELEDHLREEIVALRAGGLSADEAFLVAVKRLGAIDELTREFAREHSERLWKQLVLAGDGRTAGSASAATGHEAWRPWVAIALAVAAAVAIKLPAAFGLEFMQNAAFYPVNLAFFTLPFVAAYFAWDRALGLSKGIVLLAVFAVAAIAINAFPFGRSGPPPATQLLAALHLPIALWLPVGVAYVGGRWRASERRMDFVRFTGELFIYYVLIALGGVVLMALTFALFAAIGLDAGLIVSNWILPAGIAGAAVIAAWLVEAKQAVIENMAPVLTRIFAPLFVLVLVAFLGAVLLTGHGVSPDREVLIAFDLLLVVVFGLLLYSISAREPLAEPQPGDWVNLGLVVAALMVDALALSAIGGRIAEYGVSPNKLAALGLNLVLLVNLAGSAVVYARFLRRRAPFTRLVDWQTTYLYVLAGWAAAVAFLFPPLFGFA